VARYRGRGNGRPILPLAHIGVVEADPADWNLDPFTFIEQDGYYYARGVTDDKDEAAAYITNFIRMKRDRYVPLLPSDPLGSEASSAGLPGKS
jgi:acetylornithine deacetylase/succinyl-diaminopimelate desuccinylase-like protein